MSLTKVEIYALINENWADNNTALITPLKSRQVATQITDSMLVGVQENEILRSFSASDQAPTALDTPLQVEFGASLNSGADKVMLASNGDITFNQTGKYPVRVKLQMGRDGASGKVHLWARILLNGVQVGVSASPIIESSSFIFPMESRVVISASAGDIMTCEIMRDSAGVNEGKLVAREATVLPWVTAPSALLVISEYAGV